MKYTKYILLIFILYGTFAFSQISRTNTNILFSIQDSKLSPNLDTIYFLKEKQSLLYFFDDKVYYNNRKIYAFKNTEYYMQLLFMTNNNRNYLYIYPKYYNRSGPYIWYGLGILFEVTEKEIITKSNFDYYDTSDIDLLFEYKEFKIIRRVKIK